MRRIATINYRNNNNKIKAIVLLVMTMVLAVLGTKSYAAETNGMPFTQVEQGMNISYSYMNTEYHFVETISQMLTNKHLVTIGFIDDPKEQRMFLEVEDLSGKLLNRTPLESNIKWGCVGSVGNDSLVATLIKEGTLYYPEIRVINANGEIVKIYKCEYGISESKVKLGSFIKLSGKNYFQYPLDNSIALFEIDNDLNVTPSVLQITDANSNAYLFYDYINDKVWTCYQYNNRSRIYDYVYAIENFDDLKYSVASKKRVTREGTSTNTTFETYGKDGVLITYSKKKYLYTYSSGTFKTTTETANEIYEDDETKLIFYEDKTSSKGQMSRTIYFVNKQGSYDIELFDDDITQYVGANGLDVKGIIHSNQNEVVEVKISFNNLSKTYELKTNEEFCIHLDSTFLKEGYYDEIYLEVGSSGDGGIMFGEIPNGSTINYDGIFYDKIDDTLVFEQNPQSPINVDYTVYDSLDQTMLLSEDEYNKYHDYISAIERMNFWLKDGKKNYQEQVISTKKTGYAYALYKKNIKLNEKFSFNKNDNAYYNYISSGSKKKYNSDVWVSYAPCKDPIVTVSSAQGEYTKDDVNVNIQFDGESSDLVAYMHVVKENLDGIYEDDLVFDFSEFDSFDYLFTESGMYQVSVKAKSSFGNESNTVIKTFKIDKEGPVLKNIEYENVYESSNGLLYCMKNETNARIIVMDLSGVPNSKQIDKYMYEIDRNVISRKETSFEVLDNVGNKNIIKFQNTFIVDELVPLLHNPVLEYFKDRAEITLRAQDTESGLEGIYYTIEGEEEKKYEKTIKMSRDKYGKHTKVIIYAKDIAGNHSEKEELDVELNDAPELIIDEDNIAFTINNLPPINVLSSDKDGDDVELSLYFGNDLLCKGKNELLINLKSFENILKSFEYNTTYKLTVVASDGDEETRKNILLVKKNMEPIYKITSKSINFSNYAEVEVSIYDLDDGTYGKTTCVVSSNNIDLGTYELMPGDNTIKIKNAHLTGEHEIKFNLINKNYRTTITRKINFVNLEKIEEDNVFIKIADSYTNEFYAHALSQRENIYFYTEHAERYLNKDLNLNVCNLADAKSFLKNNEPLIICDTKITDDDLINLLNDKETADTICYETGSTMNVDPIIFSDYENDYYLDERGKNRKLTVNFDSLDFENSTKNYNHLIYDPFNNLTLNNESKKEVRFQKDKLDFDITQSGLYTLSLSEWDEIKNDGIDYSKESDNETISFYAHKKPFCKLSYKEKSSYGDLLKLEFSKTAYDEDYISINNGIWKHKVIVDTYSFDGQLLDEKIIEDGNESFELEIDKNEITKVKYIVWDFGLSPDDNRFSFSNFDEVVINKININPFADFDYYVGEKNANGYLYRMDEHENVKFENFSEYNDILATSGTREEEYQHDLTKFLSMIDNNEELYNRLTIINRFGKKDTSISKKLEMCDINLINISNLEDVQSGSSTLKFKILNAKKDNEIYLMLDGLRIDYSNDAFYVPVFGSSLNEMEMVLEVYSNRDNSYLGERKFKIKFVQNSEVINFEITNIYDPWCEVSLPASVTEMPVGVIRKGYGFDFQITTKGLSNYDDYIYIIPTYYYLDDGGIKPCEIVNYSKGIVRPYELNILNEGKQIGNLNYLYLNSDDKIIKNDEEIFFGKFYLPSGCRVRTGDEIHNDGLILVNFEIVGASALGYSYNFNTNRWVHLNNSPYHMHGDTAIFALKYDAFDDYKNYLKY